MDATSIDATKKNARSERGTEFMTSVLYLSYTGLLDPLGESQVLQYVRELAKTHRITLLTFEKAEALVDASKVSAMEAKCENAGVIWHRRIWHRKPSLLATAWDIFWGSREAIALANDAKAEIVHCRSYVASLIGLRVKRATGARLIFDMRGFWADERADTGRWKREGMVYKAIKRLEKILFLSADHVVSLTRSGVREFSKFEYLEGRVTPNSVIPTCTNLDLFQPGGVKDGSFTLGYIGSVGGWYLFDQVADVVARLQARDPKGHFLAINKGGHDLIFSELVRAGADLNRCEVRACAFDEVGQHAARMHAGVFFIMPAWSKRASCPTRMGEFLGSGVPCLANDGVGDVREDFRSSDTGIVLPVDDNGRVDLSDLDNALNRLVALATDPATAPRCRSTAESLFSLEGGVSEYDRIYRKLSSSPDDE